MQGLQWLSFQWPESAGSHHSEGVTSNCNRCGNLEMAVVRQGSQSTMLQCGSGTHSKDRFVQE